MRETGEDKPAAYSAVLAERPELYDRYTAELAAGRYAPKPAPDVSISVNAPQVNEGDWAY